jgi:predicted tellurium resistance membrane protein TerC
VDGVTRATPLLLCLVCIELSDFVFAVDSIPAVIGVSQDLLVVYSSNIFAILGLRSLYTLVAKAVSDLPYLRPAVALVLAFIGLKMILEFFDIHIPIGLSLLIVVSLLVGGILLSIYKNNKKNAKGYAKIDDKEKGYLVRK